MADYYSLQNRETQFSTKGIIISIMIIAIIFVILRAVNPTYGVYILNNEYVTILLALLVASVVIAIILRRAQKDLFNDESLV
jgi:multisubunit Na+/H+ antiporter MnhG subunit